MDSAEAVSFGASTTLRSTTLGLRPKRKERPTLTDVERKEISDAFSLFDTSGSGTIDYHDLKMALKALGFEVRKTEVRALMVANGCGDKEDSRVSRDAFTTIVTEKYLSRDPEDEWRKAFTIFDETGEGKITLKNLRRVAKELGEPLGDDELAAMIGEIESVVSPIPYRIHRISYYPAPPPTPFHR
jgi:centrin-3